jgi:NAD(P)-dependent dehydrogenase (short-subunit alcohol dehydrogenase family)
MKNKSPYLTTETAIITGSGNGIGRALAFEVAGEGAQVFLVLLNNVMAKLLIPTKRSQILCPPMCGAALKHRR